MDEIEKVIERTLLTAALRRTDEIDVARAVLAALREAGFVVVPREPTDAMFDASYGMEKDLMGARPLHSSVWRAMVTAAERK